jgi:hypothetical protein
MKLDSNIQSQIGQQLSKNFKILPVKYRLMNAANYKLEEKKF